MMNIISHFTIYSSEPIEIIAIYLLALKSDLLCTIFKI